MRTKNVEAANECTSVVGHFDCHADAMVQCTWHHLMQHVQGYTGSHGMLCHWPTARFVLPWQPTGQQSTKQRRKNAPTLLSISMAIATPQYNTVGIAR
jgi:hypothetical protein